MENNYMSSDSLIELEFLSNQRIGIHYHENMELLFLISGSLSITVEEDRFELGPGDMIVVNSSRNHSYEGTEDLFIGRFMISYSALSRLLGNGTILFWCNSAMDHHKAYDELRDVISRIFNLFLRDEKGQGQGRICLYSLYYQMLSILAGNFLLTEQDARYESKTRSQDERVDEIFSYIRVNYRKNINLKDIAEQLYLSETYISKYIKRKCGSSFIELVNSVRLGHAMEDLMYTDASVMKIAMDNGFASVAAYNKAFKTAYGTTPSEFRRSRKEMQREDSEYQKEFKRQIHEKVEAYLEKNPVEEQEDQTVRELNVFADAASNLGLWENNCGRMINAGTALDLAKTAFHEQILAMKDRIGAEYVRFWDIYDPELFVDIHAPSGRRHFDRLDAVTDFLVKHNMKPYMELGFKPLRLLKTTQDALKEIPREQKFESRQEMWDFYSDMMKHFIQRYGSEEVSKWYFEYWEKEETAFRDLSYHFSPISENEHEAYFDRFDVLANAIRSNIPEAKIGGGGFTLQHYGEKGFARILEMWKRHEEKPDFITLSCYPYQQEKEGSVYYEKRSTDMDFVRRNAETARRVMEETSFHTKVLHVSEYSMSLSNRNAVNDSCVKGAFLMQNAISCIGKVKMLGHWLFTDVYADFHDSKGLLFGGCGLLTKNGIPKPGLYVFEFLKRLYPRIVARERHYLITGNDRGSFRMVCHNLKELNYNYYMTQENEIRIQDIPRLLEDREFLTIHVKLSKVKNGTYILKQKQINKNHGSIQDEWSRLNMEPELTMEELDYLKKISAAKISIQELEVAQNVLEFNLVLEPNEIQSLYIACK
jgi:beta-xylosidase/AraC-like DNA-binding protein|nr:helix-turn-helix domain-containing protein [uncultured Schaedlerella sp.]